MSASNDKTAFPPLLGRRATPGADIEWERIMVQITFAFVIILGYLISVGMDEAQNLAAESESQRRRNVALESIVSGLSATELGQERQERIEAERKQQLEQLLRIWSEIRVERQLYRLLRQFEYAEFVPLSDDLQALPFGRGFDNLTSEIDRVFTAGDEKVAAPEVFTLIRSVLITAGFDVASESNVAVLDELSPEAYALYFDENMPAMENLRMLKLQIVDDLHKDRDSLAELQYSLVGKIAGARLERLADMPLESGQDTEPEETDLGITMLEQVLEDLRNAMRLLPETTARIRGDADPQESGKQE